MRNIKTDVVHDAFFQYVLIWTAYDLRPFNFVNYGVLTQHN